MLKSGLALALALAAALPAAAEEPTVRSRTVSYADLNMATASGIRQLDRRVRATIAELCGDAYPFDLSAQAGRRQCRSDAWSDYSARRPLLLAARNRGNRLVIAAR